MKTLNRYCFIVVAVLTLINVSQAPSGEGNRHQEKVDFTIRYRIPGAARVQLLWAVNEWHLLPDSLMPPGTTIREDLYYTEMVRVSTNVFTTTLMLTEDTQVDYLFKSHFISEHGEKQIWDTNGAPGRDYHTSVNEGAVDVQANLALSEWRNLPREFQLPGLFIALPVLVLLAFRFLPKRQNNITTAQDAMILIVAAACSVIPPLLAIRAHIIGVGWISLMSAPALLRDVMIAGSYDILFGTLAALLALLAIKLFRGAESPHKMIGVAFVGLAVITLVMADLNAKLLPYLDAPFNYQWLYYSDFLNSAEAFYAVKDNLTSDFLWNEAKLMSAYFLSILTYRKFLTRHVKRTMFTTSSLTLLLSLFGLFSIIAMQGGFIKRWEDQQLVNPLATLIWSTIDWRQPRLFTMKTPISQEDLQLVTCQKDTNQLVSTPPADDNPVRNVLLFVLESVPAKYLNPENSFGPAVTPNIHRLSNGAARFTNIYTHAPASNKAMVSLLCSTYPWLSYLSMTQEKPDVELSSLGLTLKQYGYRTAYFHSGDNRFQGARKFLAYRGFDTIEDVSTLQCKGEKFVDTNAEEPYLGGYDDSCIAEGFIDWLGNQNQEQPFFATLWTVQTHYPYFFSGKEKNFKTGLSTLNRYLNALHHADTIVGDIVEYLKRTNLISSTLVVIVADHGEAFGEHQQWIHASNIYEENIKVPLILYQPDQFDGEVKDTVGGLIDVAPTILNILNLPAPETWQGHSLFCENRSDRTFFFAPWSKHLFGLRKGSRKLILNASDNDYQVYKLDEDPDEKRNIAADSQQFIENEIQWLAAWAQYHSRVLNARLAAPAKVESR